MPNVPSRARNRAGIGAIATGLAAILIATSCREPTVVLVEARTNVPFRSGIRTSFTVGSPGSTEAKEPSATASAPWAADGMVGSLAVVPGSADDAPLAIRVVMGVDRDVRECTARDGFKGCIVARRIISYRPHAKVALPVILYERCKNVPCSESTTCSALGQCIDAKIPAGCGDTCALPGDVAPDGGIVVPLIDGGPADGPVVRGDGSVDATVPQGDAGPRMPQDIRCPGAASDPYGKAEQCCFDTAMGKGRCTMIEVSCQMSEVSLICDSPDDCGGANCCGSSSGSLCSEVCPVRTVRMCEANSDCAAGETCSGPTPFGSVYRSCATPL